ncbi:MAG: ComEC/Rec2 family competence protein [Beijerinckiaceae bacterium]|nr:ComEC/Rec2 family competence protein [Beijerinckiaceae bacterium]
MLTLLPGFALRYPIKKWAAGFAIIGAIAYDIMTGSRVGTERALFMTMIMLTAIIVGRPALTMRNLALAALVVIAIEPEAIMGASFQLSFAAVSALVAVYEARVAARMQAAASGAASTMWQPQRSSLIFDPVSMLHRFGHWLREMGLATLCATAATASYMAYDFHELSPYVLIGNPLTLTLIEFFAVPGALIGAALYPLGLDGPIWAYVGIGIRLVLEIAKWIAAAPGATIHLRDFAPWSIVFLTMTVLCMVIWRSWLMRLTAIPFAAIGLVGTVSGDRFDVVIPPSAEAVAARNPTGDLVIIGRKTNTFAAEQWLRADGDGRKPAKAAGGTCDKLACIGELKDGRSISVVYDRAALLEDCKRSAIIVTNEFVPAWCDAKLVITRRNLEAAGAIALSLNGDVIAIRTARSPTEDRPWSPLKVRSEQNWPGRKKQLQPETNPFSNDAGTDDPTETW